MRWRQTTGNKTIETFSAIDCDTFQMVNDSISVVSELLLMPPTSDLLKSTRTEGPVKFAYYGTPEGEIINYACVRMHPDQLAQLQETDPDCEKDPSISPLLCPGSAQLNANRRLFTSRTDELVPLCHVEEKTAMALYKSIFIEAFECKDQQCAEAVISYGLQLVSRDLERASAAEMAQPEAAANCYAVVSLSERIKKQLQKDALKVYRDCFRESVPRVKPTVIEVAKIAKIAHGMCLTAYTQAAAEFGSKLRDDEYYSSLEPHLIEWVEQDKPKKQKAKKP